MSQNAGDSRDRTGSWIRVVAITVFCLLTATAGAIAGHDDAPSTTPTRLGSPQLVLHYQAPWSPTTAGPVPGLALDQPVALRLTHGGLELVAGTAQVSNPQLLPTTFLKTIKVPQTKEQVGLSGAQGLRYRRLTPKDGGARFSLIVVPTRSTVAFMVCRRPGRSIDAADQAACDTVERTIRFKEAVRPLAPTAGYARPLELALTSLHTARRAGLDRLASAKTVPAQAAVLKELRGTCRAKARAVDRLTAGPQERTLQARLVSAVDDLCDAFSSMATAAAGYDRPAYAAAAKRSTVAARSVNTSVRAFAAAGYEPD